MILIQFPIWIIAVILRFALIVVGWFFVPLTLVADGARRTPPLWRYLFGNVEDIPAKAKKNRWTKYVEMAWRNPLTGLDALIKQPRPEKHPNPDHIVRLGYAKKAARYMSDGIFWEYWSLRKLKSGKYWEFRIGWKFVDGNEDFVPTLQVGPKK